MQLMNMVQHFSKSKLTHASSRIIGGFDIWRMKGGSSKGGPTNPPPKPLPAGTSSRNGKDHSSSRSSGSGGKRENNNGEGIMNGVVGAEADAGAVLLNEKEALEKDRSSRGSGNSSKSNHNHVMKFKINILVIILSENKKYNSFLILKNSSKKTQRVIQL